MDQLKDAFQKVKQDIDFLRKDLFETNLKIANLTKKIQEIDENLQKVLEKKEKNTSIDLEQNPSIPYITPTNPAQIQHINPLFSQFKAEKPVFSTGNSGVPTDKQTNRQTDKQTENTSIKSALEILNSLDSLKKEIRLKFKQLTDQEMIIFSAVYQFDEENGFSDYKSLSQRLNLTESSIRDYIGRLIKKGIPVEKTKLNNKNIRLTLSKNLKNVVSLSTILQLRGL